MTAVSPGPEVAITIEDVMALSPLQQGLFSRAVLTSGGPADPYVISMAADVSGPVDVDLLRRCASGLLVRHANLRASFLHHNLPHPVQVVPSHAEPKWRHVSVTSAELPDLEADERALPFELEHGPSIRFLLAELGSGRWRLMITAHHIVLDGWSLPVLVAELVTLYGAGGELASLGDAPRPYRDYIGWLADRDQDASETVWREYLAALPGPTLLAPTLALREPTGLPRRTELVVDEAETACLIDGARSHGVTVNTLLQVAWALVLARFTDRDDVVFGVTVSGRPAELASVESMVGLFVNTVPLRVRLDTEVSVAALCAAVQRDGATLRDHGYLTHSRLRALGGVGEMFDTLFVYENFPPGAIVGTDEFHSGAMTFRPAALESLAHFPVTIAAHVLHSRLTVIVEAVEHALGVTDAHTLARRLMHAVRLLLSGWEAPARDIDVLLPDGVSTVTVDDEPHSAGGGFAERFAATARVHPDRPALSWAGGRLTYRELDDAVDSAAAALLDRGVGPEVSVAVRLPRSHHYVIAMLAVLRAGGMCVPLEIDMPDERVRSILRQTGATIVVDVPITAAHSTSSVRPTVTHPDHAAYVVFTSGTTGEPKGVIGTHRALLAYADDHAREVLQPAAARIGRPLRIAHAWSFAFDAAWQPLAALLDGHAVHVVDEADRRDAEALTAIIAAEHIDMIDTTPSMFGQLRACGLLDGAGLSVLALGGEAVSPDVWEHIRDTCSRTGMAAFNCYGPTETTVEAVVADVVDHTRPVIGYPNGGTRAMILDSRLRATPDGVVGELYLAGAQVTRGYLHRPGETATRYVATSDGRRMYRTGDLVRRFPDGSLQFIGRADGQLKIRGYRVEPKEVEAVLNSHVAVRQTHVSVDHDDARPRLTAFVVSTLTIAELRSFAASRLPRFMMPQRFVTLDAMPLTANGKPDERALRAATPHSESVSLPGNDTERVLTQLFAELLALPHVDVDADVLELGLDSIAAVSAIQAARRRGIPLQARMIAECGTVRELAAVLDTATASVRADDDRDGPLSALPALHWLYEHGDPRRFGQAHVLRLPTPPSMTMLQTMLDAVVAGHPVLRCRLDRATMSLIPGDGSEWPLVDVETDDEAAAIADHVVRAFESLDPERGSLLSAAWVHRPGESGVLVLIAHVLALDPVSWRLVFAELDAAWHAVETGHAPAVAAERTGYGTWSDALASRAHRVDSLAFWERQLAGDDPPVGSRCVDPAVDRAGQLVTTATVLDADVTLALLESPRPLQHLVTAATVRCLSRWRARRGQHQRAPLLALESHGRADTLVGDSDTSETVGLLTAIYPLRFDPSGSADDVEARLAAVPGDGIDFGLLRYLRKDTADRLRAYREPQVLLNFLGRTDLDAGGVLQPVAEASAPLLPEPNVAVRHELTLVAGVLRVDGRPRLAAQWRTLPDVLGDADVAALRELWQECLRELASEP